MRLPDMLDRAAPLLLEGSLVLIVEADTFLADYIRRGIERAGGSVAAALPSCREALRHLAGPGPLPSAACIDLRGSDGWSAALLSALNQSGVPCLLIGAPARETAASLQPPFAAFQVVDALADVIRARRAQSPAGITRYCSSRPAAPGSQ